MQEAHRGNFPKCDKRQPGIDDQRETERREQKSDIPLEEGKKRQNLINRNVSKRDKQSITVKAEL